MIRNSRILRKGRGDTTKNDREPNRHTESGSHQADTYRGPRVYAGVIRALPACTGQAGRS